MGQIPQFIRPYDVFDPETLVILGEAYDKALASLHDRGQPLLVREIMAERIFDLATMGERDPDRLCKAALGTLGSRPSQHRLEGQSSDNPVEARPNVAQGDEVVRPGHPP
jgi:hypothetical protein